MHGARQPVPLSAAANHHPSARHPWVIFVPAGPGKRGLWIRTHVCVLSIDCRSCDAKPGEFCRRLEREHSGSTHAVRRSDYLKQLPCRDCGKPKGRTHGRFCWDCGRSRAREAARRSAERWHRDNPEKIRCHQLTQAAMKAGKLKRPKRCSRCRHVEDRIHRLNAHHYDYTKPLEVRWMCTSCHMFHHSEVRRAARLAVAS